MLTVSGLSARHLLVLSRRSRPQRIQFGRVILTLDTQYRCETTLPLVPRLRGSFRYTLLSVDYIRLAPHLKEGN